MALRRLLLILAIVGQLTVLAIMVYGKESIIWTGKRMYLQTAPIDPRDPFRGDFVRLHYSMNDLSRVELKLLDNGESELGTESEFHKDQRVYAVLKPLNEVRRGQEPDINSMPEIYDAAYVTDQKPEDGQFIRGRVSRAGNVSQSTARFGIEQLFVQQGHGIDMEQRLGVRGGVQIPLQVELAIAANGSATLVGHRFGDLGIQLERIIEVLESEPTREFITGVSLSITNVSDRSLRIPDPSNRCAWELVPVMIHEPDQYVQAFDCDSAIESLSVPDVILLPDESRSISIRFSDSEWYVKPASELLREGTNSTISEESDDAAANTGDLQELARGQLFRLVFQSTVLDETADDSAAERWDGKLYSQAFNAQGIVD